MAIGEIEAFLQPDMMRARMDTTNEMRRDIVTLINKHSAVHGEDPAMRSVIAAALIQVITELSAVDPEWGTLLTTMLVLSKQ